MSEYEEQDIANKIVYMVITSDEVDDGNRLYPTREMAESQKTIVERAYPGATVIIRELTIEELYNELPDVDDLHPDQ